MITMPQVTPSEDLLAYLADTNLAAGTQYGLWVERSPSVEEQISLSSMSQDKLGHARAYYQVLEQAYDRDTVALQFDRSIDEMAWNPAWTVAIPDWPHLVLSQVLFSRGLLVDARAVAEETQAAGLLNKIEQEEAWHTRHADAWLTSLTRDGITDEVQAALEDLWPYAVTFFGAEDLDRFPQDLESGARTASDDELRRSFLDEVVPLLEARGFQVLAEKTDAGWTTDPVPSDKLLADLREQARENALELVALFQDPEARELAELT